MATTTPSNGSRTVTVHDTEHNPDNALDLISSTPAVLRLRGGPNQRPRVVWREDVIDNENMGKKSSKICCIYHKTRKFGESSSEDSSSDDEPLQHHSDHHSHNHRCHHQSPRSRGDCDGTPLNGSKVAEAEELSSDNEPNAYERAPRKIKSNGECSLTGTY